MLTRTRGVHRFLFLTGAIVGIGLVPAPSQAQPVTQLPSVNNITVDGFFTDWSGTGPITGEWSDVTPILFNNGQSWTYTAVDPGKDALYLMYDELNATNNFGGANAAGSVEFSVGADHYVVSFFAAGIVVLKNGAFFDATGIMEGARFFGPSPNSMSSHRMFELEVAFDCTDPTLVPICPPTPGVYSPAPSHWGATASNSNTSPAHCELLSGTACNSPAPASVPCSTPGAFQVFGEQVSAACVEVMPGTGGTVKITRIPLPAETNSVPSLTVWGMIALALSLVGAGMTFVLRRYHAIA